MWCGIQQFVNLVKWCGGIKNPLNNCNSHLHLIQQVPFLTTIRFTLRARNNTSNIWLVVWALDNMDSLLQTIPTVSIVPQVSSGTMYVLSDEVDA